jgi:hypothetical protein
MQYHDVSQLRATGTPLAGCRRYAASDAAWNHS